MPVCWSPVGRHVITSLKGRKLNTLPYSYLKTFYSSKSVKVGYFPLVEELAKKGHKVIIVTPFKGIHLLEYISI